MREKYIPRQFKPDSLDRIEEANDIIDDYQGQGYTLTLRQLYYQFVSRDLIPNTEKSYKSLGKLISDARLAGMIDWEAMEDRTRNLQKNLWLESPRQGLEYLRDHWYGIDMWANQPTRVEVWIEKEALIGVIEDVCENLDVPYFACKGNVSQSEQWAAGKRMFERWNKHSQRTTVLHLGDHDPSGVDMTRDNQDRLSMFSANNAEVARIALNMDQIEEYGPPPNPAKIKDSRYKRYREKYGESSWELDALEPSVIVGLIRDRVTAIRDPALWGDSMRKLANHKAILSDMVEQLDGQA